jgi:dTDP-4-amino-4,6-dideoxygalactose transaminase
MEWRVKFVDYPRAFAEMETEIMDTVRGVLAAGDLMMRQQLKDFEAHLAAFVGTSHAVGVSNCTDGLRLTLEALGVGPGDEVVTVAHTFLATLAAIHHVGATPVLVDVGDDYNLDPEVLDQAITPRTRAILPVHLNGRLCEMDRVMEVAEAHDLIVLEDSAQALGASFDGRRGGTWGAAGAFSFYPAKLLGGYGDGGAVVTNDGDLAERLLALRDHGRVSKSGVNGWGWNCRLDNLQAALLDLKLRRLPDWIGRRRQLASMYDEALEGLDLVKRPPAPSDSGSHFDVFQNYVIEVERRDELAAHLAVQGIETMTAWPVPVHRQPIGLPDFSLPRTEALALHALSLPLTVELEEDQVITVTSAVRSFFN